ncbi:hypothetical protein ACP70R_048277 [Stipagrostis hirtigluma subsp. patula]
MAPPPRRRRNSSLFESSTIITANLIMASSSYLLSRITPRAPAAQPSPSSTSAKAPTRWSSSAVTTRSVEPVVGCRTLFMEAPDDGVVDGEVDQRAEVFIRRFRERALSEAASSEAAATASTAAAMPQQPAASGTHTKWATVHRYPR